MKQIIVHMGMPKCGSSSIQHYLASLDESHRKLGAIYPESGRSKGGYRSHAPIAELSGDKLEEVIQDIAREWSTVQATRTGILSTEAWGRPDRLENLRRVLTRFAEIYPDARIRVLAYIRNPYSYVESCYAQFAKAGLFGIDPRRFFKVTDGSVEDFVHSFERQYGFPIFSNLEAILRVRSALDGFQVSFRSIERGDMTEPSLLADLCSFLELPLQEKVAGTIRNERINLRQLEVLKCARKIFSTADFMLLRSYMIDHPHCLIECDPGTRYEGAHIGPRLAADIRECLLLERTQLESLVETGVDGLCADRWQPYNCQSVMEPIKVDQVIDEANRVLRHCKRRLFREHLQEWARLRMGV